MSGDAEHFSGEQAAGRRKLIYLLTEDWFFLSHFLERALAAQKAGFEVIVAAREGAAAEKIRVLGLRFEPIPFRRRGLNPLAEIAALRAIRALYRRERPHIVHQIALKPILYGTWLARGSHVVNAPVGMGFAFTSGRLQARLIRPLVGLLLHRSLNPPGSRVIFENSDDLSAFAAAGTIRRGSAVLIRGAGVDIDALRPPVEPDGPLRVMFAGRMLRTKGVEEFVRAARQLSTEKGYRFVLAGAPDHENPDSLSESQLKAWHDEGIVEWLGFRPDIASVMAKAHIVVLPSYREGLPKALLEAMALGRPIIATDVPGCREAVAHGDNGLLVPPRDSKALAEAIALLGADRELRVQMGMRGRGRAEAEFASHLVIKQTLSVYELFRSAR